MEKRLELFLFEGNGWWWLRHSLFWVVMYLDEILYTLLEQDGLQDLDLFGIPLLLDIITVYVNIYLFIPKYLNQKKYLAYLFFSVSTVILNVLIVLIYIYLPENEWPHLGEFVSSFISTITLLATAIAIKVGKFYFKQQQVTEHLKLEQSRLELNYLKQQINPHFLFNVLNTIHIQSISEPTSVSETVHQLSDLLRYQIYEAGTSDKVLLQKEMDFLKNYVSLEELRRSHLTVTWKEHQEMPKIRITPFLFLPLIENALKHSRSINEDPATINISWHHLQDTLTLDVNNSVGDAPSTDNNGFGIDNLKKRLNHLYPGSHQLTLSIKGNVFSASLKLEFHEGNNH